MFYCFACLLLGKINHQEETKKEEEEEKKELLLDIMTCLRTIRPHGAKWPSLILISVVIDFGQTATILTFVKEL